MGVVARVGTGTFPVGEMLRALVPGATGGTGAVARILVGTGGMLAVRERVGAVGALLTWGGTDAATGGTGAGRGMGNGTDAGREEGAIVLGAGGAWSRGTNSSVGGT